MLNDGQPWLRVALLTYNYLGKEFKQVGSVSYANSIKKANVEKLKEQEGFLENVHEFLKHTFWGCQPKEREPAVFKAMAKFAVAVGKLTYKGEGKIDKRTGNGQTRRQRQR